MRTIARCAATLLVLALTFGVGSIVSGGAGEAVAEVYRNLSPLELFLRESPSPGGWRLSHMNGVAVPYSVHSSPAGVAPLLEQAGRDLVAADAPAVRVESDDWAVGAFVPPHPAAAPPEGSSPILVAAAFRTATDLSATGLAFLFEGVLDLASILPRADGDVPGNDPGGIPRYPGLVRAVAIDLGPSGSDGEVAVYHGPGARGSVEGFYRAEMARDRWRLVAEPELGSDVSEAATVLAYRRSGQDCAIGIAPSRVPGEIVVSITTHGAGSIESGVARLEE